MNAVSCSGPGLPSFRAGDWKLIPGAGSGGWSRGGDEDPIQLYNLADDLGETNNLATTYPEKVKAMQDQFEELIAHGRSTPGKPLINDVEVVRYPN
jgi:arylsulfatase A-like enzyme